MMMKILQKPWLLLALVAGALVLADPGLLRAQGAPPPPDPPPIGGAGGPGPEHIAALAGELGLSAEQHKALRALLLGLRKQQIQARADLELAGLELQTALEADEPDAKVVGAQVDKLGALETQMRKARMLAMLAARKLLTPAQREKLAQRMLAMQAMRPPMPPGDPAGPMPRPPGPEPLAPGPNPMDPFARPRGVRPPVAKAPPGVDVMDPFGRKPTGMGNLVVMASPFAEVWLDGKQLGTTPLKASVQPGKHKLEFRFKGGATSVRSIDVRAGETTKIAMQAPSP